MTPMPITPRRPFARPLFALAMLAVSLVLTAAPLRAQSLFAAALYVNDEAITNYDITQEMRFLQFVGVAGADSRAMAIERLIEDRLQIQEVRRLGGRLTPDQLDAAMAEFAQRGNLTAEELLTRMAQAGIDRETYIEFVRSGALWRQLIQARYGGQAQISDAQVDQALSVEGLQPVTEVLISEIFLPIDPQFAEAVQRIIPQIQRITTEADFANAARQVSAAPSSASGGRVDRWINVASMPDPVGPAMADAAVGTVVGPLDVPGAYAFFQLRARRESRSVPPSAIEVEYRRVDLPGGRSDTNLASVERIRARVDACGDFEGVTLREMPGLPDGSVVALTSPQSALPNGTRAELERLNPGQISSNQVENGALVVLMLCARRVGPELAPPRAEVRASLLNRALEAQAIIYLRRLRAEAEIRYP